MMDNKVALVTGGMGGIGTAICRHLIAQGARVIATYNQGGNHDAAKKWQEQQCSQGYNIIIHYVDVSDFDSCNTLIKNIESEYNRIDILINNAGITRDVQLYKMNLEQWRAVL